MIKKILNNIFPRHDKKHADVSREEKKRAKSGLSRNSEQVSEIISERFGRALQRLGER